ncbi:MAG: hypothetical protein JNG84_14090 [Archangium sp.]|nr:hypothetical protein [Archangium sp.]
MKRAAMMMVTCGMMACGTPSMNTDSGIDAGELLLIYNASGTVTVHPDAADAGHTAALAGLTLRIEEPFRVASNDPLGLFSTSTLQASGTFSGPFDVELVSLGVAAGIRDDTADGGRPRVIRAATLLFDRVLEGKKPDRDITNGRAYAIPTGFHDTLSAAVGEARIRSLLKFGDGGTLIESGCILGKVVDAQGAPVAGATIETKEGTPAKNAERASRFFYPSADYASTGSATSSNGLFVYVHNGGEVEPPFRFQILGKPEYKERNAGAVKDACLVMTVYPGATAP